MKSTVPPAECVGTVFLRFPQPLMLVFLSGAHPKPGKVRALIFHGNTVLCVDIQSGTGCQTGFGRCRWRAFTGRLRCARSLPLQCKSVGRFGGHQGSTPAAETAIVVVEGGEMVMLLWWVVVCVG
jgi:hypothetical protein